MTVEEKILQLNQYTLGTNTIEQNIGELVSEVPAEKGDGRLKAWYSYHLRT